MLDIIQRELIYIWYYFCDGIFFCIGHTGKYRYRLRG